MAIQSVVGGLWIPRVKIPANVGDAFVSLLLDASAEKYAAIFNAPKTGTLDKIEFRVGTVAINAASQVRVSFQDVSLVNGDPDGTQDQYRDIAGSAFASNTWMIPGLMTSDGTDTGVKRAVTRGDLLCAVIEYSTFTAADSVNISVFSGTTLITALGITYNDHFTASWAKQTGSGIIVALKYDDGTYAFVAPAVLPATTFTTTTFSNASTPDERGLIFQFPSSVAIGGAWIDMAIDGAVDIVLYDSDGSTALETISLDPDVESFGNGRVVFVWFTADRTLTANTNYRLVVKPTSATTVRVGALDVNAAANMDGLEGGQNFHLTTRTDAGAWSQTTTTRPVMGLLVVGL